MTTPYVDPQTVHNPTAGGVPPATWGDTIRDDLEFLVERPSAKMENDSTTVSVAQAFVKMGYEAGAVWDTDSFITDSNTFTIPAGLAGKYWVQAHTRASSTSASQLFALYVNGSRVAQDAMAGANLQFGVRALLDLAVGDTVDSRCYQSSGTANWGGPAYDTFFEILWMSR